MKAKYIKSVAPSLLVAFAFLVLPLTAHAQHTQPLKVISLDPTVFFPREKPNFQVARLTLDNNSNKTLSAGIEIKIEAKKTSRQQIDTITPGKSVHDILVPDIQAPATIKLQVRCQGCEKPALFQTEWKPQRHWVVYVVKSAHTDLGYEKSEFIKQGELAQYVDDAMKMADSTWDGPDESRYRWMIEHLFWFNGCQDDRPWPWMRRLIYDYIATGKMSVMAPYCGVHSHWHSLEQLCRSVYWSRRHMRDRFDLDLPLYYIADNPSVAWPVAQIWAQAGGKYIIDTRQGWRTGEKDYYCHTKVPPIFWWVGPNGKDKVLFCNSMSAGPQKDKNPLVDQGDWIKSYFEDTLKRYEKGEYGPYPYDLLFWPMYYDHQPPSKTEMEGVMAWNRKWRYPEIRVDDPTKFMQKMERKYGDVIPTLSGDMNNYSADYAAAIADLFGAKRRGTLRLAVAEGFDSIARMINPQHDLRQPLFDRVYQQICEFDDHTWPTGPAPCDYNETNFGIFKSHSARRVDKTSSQELNRALHDLAGQIAVERNSVAVFNTVAKTRGGLVKLKAADWPALARNNTLLDTQNGKITPVQTIGDELLFYAKNVPAFGYKTYAIVPKTVAGKTASAKPDAGETKMAAADTLENRFYRIRFDKQTGGISSLFDKQLSRELVDQNSPHKLNQFIYDYRFAKESLDGIQSSPKRASMRAIATGPVAASMEITAEEPESGASLRQIVTIYRDVKRVDITNHVEHARMLWGDERTFCMEWGKVGTRYQDNIYFAFPLNVSDAAIRGEYSLGTVRPYDDQLRFGSHDFLSVQQYVDCSNDQYGVTWVTQDVPVVHFGEIRYNRFSNTYKPQRPWLYSYAMSNRLEGLVVHHPDDSKATSHYTLTSHAGDWSCADAAEKSWAVCHPLSAIMVRGKQSGRLGHSQSFVSIDSANVCMTGLKPSELPGRGFIIRLVETGQKANTVAHVRTPLISLAKANLCSIVEDDLEELELDADRHGFRVPLDAFATATVRMTPEGKLPGKVAGLQVKSANDASVTLEWAPVAGASTYRVYRLPGPGERPALNVLVGETAEPRYTDNGLNLDTPYCYRVSAVAPGNLEGKPSDELSARTDKENVSPPGPVAEPILVERGCRRLILVWRSNKEPDVTAYEVYRSTTPDFSNDAAHLVHRLDHPTPHYRQWFIDTTVEPDTRYFYRVLAVDDRGQRSPTAETAQWKLCKDPGPPQAKRPAAATGKKD